MQAKPYVVTDDLELVFDRFKALGKAVPDICDLREASHDIHKGLRSVFDNVEVVSSAQIVSSLLTAIKSSDLPVVSLTGLLSADRVAGSIECSRSVEILTGSEGFFSYNDAGLKPRRSDVPDVETQFNNLVAALGDAKEVALADDVIFSGGTILRLTERLAQAGIEVKKAYGSLIMEEAIGKLADKGIEATAELVYADVVDEVCLRDFIVGAPDGGRNVVVNGGYASAPYLSPFGNVCKWASIPQDHVERFSRVAVESSHTLWTKMDRLNGASHLAGDLIKPVIFWRPEDKIVDNLKTILDTGRINGHFRHS